MKIKLLRNIKDKIRRFFLSKTKAKIVHVWQNQTKNIGDLCCAPSLYFQELNVESTTICIMDFVKPIKLTDKVIIIGGGV